MRESTTASTKSIERLVEELADDDDSGSIPREALSLLYDRLFPYVDSIAWPHFRNKVDADAVANEVFFRLWSNRKVIIFPNRLLSWLRKVTMSVVNKEMRAGRVPDDPGLTEPTDPHDPTAIFDILEALPDELRDIVRLIDLCGFTVRETARCVGKDKNKVSRLHGDAMDRLRREWDSERPPHKPR